VVPPDGEPSAEFVARQETYKGFGDALAMAFEMVMTPLLFGLGGYALDRWLGTSPVFTLILSVLGIIGMSAKMWYGYEARMQAHDAAAPWAKSSGPAVTPHPSTTPQKRDRP